MSKKKIRRSAPSHPSRSILKPVVGALLVAGLIWGLASLFQPPADLVPYTKFKKTEVSASEPADPPVPDHPPTSAAPAEPTAPDDPVAQADPDKIALDSMKAAAGSPLFPTPLAPPTDLPRETLEYISKGRHLVVHTGRTALGTCGFFFIYRGRLQEGEILPAVFTIIFI